MAFCGYKSRHPARDFSRRLSLRDFYGARPCSTGLALGRAKIVPITTDQKADPDVTLLGNTYEAGIEHEGI